MGDTILTIPLLEKDFSMDLKGKQYAPTPPIFLIYYPKIFES